MADNLAARVAAPVIDTGRCVHASSVRASCKACVETCPKQALVLNDQGLFIELAECDGCGICAAACPEGAIAVPVEPVMDADRTSLRAFAACRSTRLPGGKRKRQTWIDGPALVPCLHSFGLEELAEFYWRGVRELVLADAPCESCASGSASGLAARVSSFNGLLLPRGMDQLRIVELPPLEWRRRRDAAIDAARKAVRADVKAGGELPRKALLTGRAKAHDASADGPAPALPRINAQLCTGCLACVTACPYDAFALITRPGGRRELLIADGRRCTGCSLCSDACPAKCISVERDPASDSAGIALGQAVCRSCNAGFRLPVAKADGRALCPNCRSANRPTKTAQVIR